MSGFDPELYLRLLGERELASGLDLRHETINGRAQLSTAAAAFVATGILDADVAGQLATDYETASALRSGDRHRLNFAAGRQSGRPGVEPLAPRRVHALQQTISLPDTRKLLIHSLTVAGDTGWLQCEIYSEAPFRHGTGARQPSLAVRLPGGQALSPNFNGGWSDHHAKGRFEFTAGELDPGLEWIEVEGTRCELPAPIPPPVVALERLGPEGLATRYLWQLLANVGQHHSPNFAGAMAALLAAGRLDGDDPELEALSWVADTHDGRAAGPRHLRGGAPAPAEGIPERVPAQWRSLWSGRRPAAGASGGIPIAATTPVFDGVSVAVNFLRSGAEGFILEAETSGVSHPHPHFGARFGVPLAWWAHDDRGHSYLGHVDGWSGGETHGRGEIAFGPLDPRATELTLAITALNGRALIRVPLDWGT